MKILASHVLTQGLLLSLLESPSDAFSIPTISSTASQNSLNLANHQNNRRDLLRMKSQPYHNNDSNDNLSSFDPFNLSNDTPYSWSDPISQKHTSNQISKHSFARSLPSGLAAATTAAVLIPTSAANAVSSISKNSPLGKGDFNPDNFRPVCPASDGIYRFAQTTTQSVVGPDNFIEYGPLIAGGLLRIRLELCVVESFFNEAVGPFIEREGLKWVLPLHETVETFLAGSIFALASTFILVGSTKIISVLVTYTDVFIGVPCRLFGGFIFDRARGKPVTLDVGFGPFKTRLIGPGDAKEEKKAETLEDILDFSDVESKDLPVVVVSGGFKAVGETSKLAREVFEALDLFVGRYLTLLATGYIGIKFLHFKIFPDFPPF